MCSMLLKVLQIVSTMGTTSLEDVAAASEGSPLLIFQLYVQRDRDFTASLIQSKFSILMCLCSTQEMLHKQMQQNAHVHGIWLW